MVKKPLELLYDHELLEMIMVVLNWWSFSLFRVPVHDSYVWCGQISR